jgi:hypothetical protein
MPRDNGTQVWQKGLVAGWGRGSLGMRVTDLSRWGRAIEYRFGRDAALDLDARLNPFAPAPGVT